MSLVSTKNLVAPLTNMVHLITILLIAVAFAVLRLSGASISLDSVRSPSKRATTVTRTPAQAKSQHRDLTSTLLENNKPPQPWNEKKVEKPSVPERKQSGGLDDIEKALGM